MSACPSPTLSGAGPADFREAVLAHRPVMRRLVSRILSDPAEVEETLQEAALRAWKALPSWRGDAALSTWLGKIAINQALERLRYQRRHGTVSLSATLSGCEDDSPLESFLADAAPSPLSVLLRQERIAVTKQCILGLPSLLRGVLVAVELQQKSFADAASELGVSVSALKSRHHRGKRILRQRLAAKLGPGVL